MKSSEILSRQTTIDSLLLSIAAGQPSDSIAIVCSNESNFLAKSTIAHCMHNIGFHWQMFIPSRPERFGLGIITLIMRLCNDYFFSPSHLSASTRRSVPARIMTCQCLRSSAISVVIWCNDYYSMCNVFEIYDNNI